MITLYGAAHTRSTRPLWALEELQLPYAYVYVDLRHKRAGEQPLKALNPGQKVPVLKHNDFLLTESMAICLYIAEQDERRQLLPERTSRDRARLLQWCSFAISELEQPLWTLAKHSFVLPKALRIPAAGETAQHEFNTALEVLAAGLGDRTCILGERFTVADILIANTLDWTRSAQWALHHPALEDYRDRMMRRPALVRARERESAAADA
jgi:glutathione S-transferase